MTEWRVRRAGRMVRGCALVCVLGTALCAPAYAQTSAAAPATARRLAGNPLITVRSSPTLGGNVNGATVMRVPPWVQQPLGRYYMYFANHMGEAVRLAYADAPEGPWRIHEPGVLHVRETALFREQPDPQGAIADFYTHVASPDIFIDADRQRFVMWVHGWWTNGERWPSTLAEARQWARERGYAQFTQAAVSTDGLHFTVQPAITKTSYLRVFRRGDTYFALSRLGLVSRASDPLAAFEIGQSVFAGTPFAGRVRHVAIVPRGDTLQVWFTAIGDAPERVYRTAVDLRGDWTTWRAGAVAEVLLPEAGYECTDLPNAPSESGDIDGPAQQIRDPFVFVENDRAWLYYAVCGEQGIAAAEIPAP